MSTIILTIIAFFTQTNIEAIVCSLIASLLYENSKSVFCSLWNRDKGGVDAKLRNYFEQAVDKCVANGTIAEDLKQKAYGEYLRAVKAQLLEGKAYEIDGMLFRNILEEFERSVKNDTVFMLQILFSYGKSIKRTAEDCRKELSAITERLESIYRLAEESQAQLSALGLTSKYVLPPIVVGTDNMELPDRLIRRDQPVRNIADEVDAKGCVLLYGDLWSGKSVTSALVGLSRAEDKPVIFRLAYEKTINVRTLVERVAKEKCSKLLIIDGMPQYNTEQMEDLCRLLKSKVRGGMKFLINGRSFDDCMQKPCYDFAYIQQPLVTKDELMASEPRCTAAVANLIIAVSKGYPVLVDLLLFYLKMHNWKLSEEQITEFFSIPDRENIQKAVGKKIREFVSDNMELQLLSRLSLFWCPFTEDEAVRLADVQPYITTPKARLQQLLADGLVVEKGGKLSVSQLIRQVWKPDLIATEMKDCANAIVDVTLQKKTINVFDAVQSVMILHRVGEYEKAGQLYITCLINLIEQKMFDQPDALHLMMLWRDMPLPKEMSLQVRTVIRVLHVQILSSMKEKDDFAFAELEQCMAELPDGSVLKSAAACGVVVQYTLRSNIAKALQFIPYLHPAASAQGELHELAVTQQQISDKLPTVMLSRVKNKQELFDWFDFFEKCDNPVLEMEADAAKYALNNVLKESGEESVLGAVIKRTQDRPLLRVFHLAAVCRLIQYRASLKDFASAWTLYEEKKYLASDPIGKLWINHVIGCYYCDMGDTVSAMNSWIEGCSEASLSLLPDVYIFTKVCIARLHVEHKEYQLAVDTLLSVTNDADFAKEQSEQEQALIRGELAIAYWENGQRMESFLMLHRVQSYLWAQRDKDDDELRLLIIKLGLCALQYLRFMENGKYEDDSKIPFISLFYLRHEHLLNEYNKQRKGVINMLMFMLAAAVGADTDLAYTYACQAIEGSVKMLEERMPVCMLFNELIPILLEHDDMERVRYLVRAELALIPGMKGIGTSADYMTYVPMVLLCMKRLMDVVDGKDDNTTDAILDLLDAAKDYLGDDKDLLALDKSVRQGDAKLANGTQMYPMMCAQLFLYEQLNVPASFFLLMGGVQSFDIHRYYASRFMRSFAKAFAHYLLVNKSREFASGGKDLLGELQKIDRSVSNDRDFAKKTLRLLHAFSKADIPLNSSQEEFCGL